MASEDVAILLLTLRVAALATLGILPIGVGAAYLLSRRQGIGIRVNSCPVNEVR